MLIELSTDDPAVLVPATVRIAGGATSADFTVNTTPIRATTTAIITGKNDGVGKIVGLAVRPPALSSISLNPTLLTGGSTSTATVRLNGNAPAGGIVVTLSSNKPSRAGVPASVTVAPGKDTATVTVNTTAGEQAAPIISGSFDDLTKKASLTIQSKKPQLSATSALKRSSTSEPNRPAPSNTY
jgi:hypothetical protein